MKQRPILRTSLKKIYLFFRSIILNLLRIILFRLPDKQFMAETVKNILVIKIERIGDLVLATPVLRHLKKEFTNFHISLLVNDYTKDLVIDDPNIDELLIYKKPSRLNIFYWIKFSRMLKNKYFDLVVDLTCNEDMFLPVLFSYFSKAKYTIGLDQFGRGFLFNHRVYYDREDKPLTASMLDIVRPLGIYTNDTKPQITIPDTGRVFVKELLHKLNIRQNDLLIGIHPGAYYPSQRWQEEGFAEVADELINRYKAKVIIVSSHKERGVALKTNSLMKNKPQAILTQITLAQLMGLISRLDLFICNNSGPLHIAVALDTPTISTMGPTNPKRWYPQGDKHIVIRKEMNCSPCNLGRCNRHECMKLITAEEILKSVEVQLKIR